MGCLYWGTAFFCIFVPLRGIARHHSVKTEEAIHSADKETANYANYANF